MIANGISSTGKYPAISTVCALPPPLSHPVWFYAGMNPMQKMVLPADLVMASSGTGTDIRPAAVSSSEPPPLALCDALRVKSAELWLRLGWAELASRELESASSQASRHPWTLRVQMLVWSALILE